MTLNNTMKEQNIREILAEDLTDGLDKEDLEWVINRILPIFSSHHNTTLKEIEENEKKVLECLSKIKDIDQKRCNEASKENKVYDVSVTSWAQTAETIIYDIKQLIHQKLIK